MIFVIQIVIVAVLLIKGLWLLIKNFDDVLHKDIDSHVIQEDDVMTLINTLMLNTKV